MIVIPDKYFCVFENAGMKRIYHEKEIIFMTEDAADSVYLIESGRVRVYIPGIEGKDTTLAV